jgi:hypothetical protein
VAVRDFVSTLLLEILIICLIANNILDPTLIKGVLCDDVQNLNLIISSLLIMRGTFLHFKSHMSIIQDITGQPNRREMAPAQFLHNHISIDHNFTHMDWMIAAYLIIRDSFILRLVTIGIQVFLIEFIFEGSCCFTPSVYSRICRSLVPDVLASLLLIALVLLLSLLALLFLLGSISALISILNLCFVVLTSIIICVLIDMTILETLDLVRVICLPR